MSTVPTTPAEPVGTVYTMEALVPGGSVKCHVQLHRELPAGTKLYASPSQASEPEWISVNDRLPALHHEILMWGPGGRVCSGWRANDGDSLSGIWWPADEGGWYEEDEVTHWRELPAPPHSDAIKEPQHG